MCVIKDKRLMIKDPICGCGKAFYILIQNSSFLSEGFYKKGRLNIKIHYI